MVFEVAHFSIEVAAKPKNKTQQLPAAFVGGCFLHLAADVICWLVVHKKTNRTTRYMQNLCYSQVTPLPL
jgi:hypothetical protein